MGDQATASIQCEKQERGVIITVDVSNGESGEIIRNGFNLKD